MIAGFDLDVYYEGVVSILERQGDRLRLYNLASVGEERQWLRDVLLSSETESSSDDDSPAAKELRIKRLLKERHYHNKYAKDYYKDPGVRISLIYIYVCPCISWNVNNTIVIG